MLDVKSIDVFYGASRALSEVSVGAVAGKVTCVLGRNGVGKTTLIRAVAGLQQPTFGTIMFDGEDITKFSTAQPARKGIALVPQGREIFATLTVEENLKTGYACLPRAISLKRYLSCFLFSKTCWRGAAAIFQAGNSSN